MSTLSGGPNIVTNGLVLYLDAANSRSYPGSGTTWFDMIGGRNGSFVGGVSYVPNNNGAISFNGSTGNVTIASSSYWNTNVFGTATSFTLSCWVNPTQFVNWDSLITKADYSTLGGWYSANEGASIWTDVNGFQGVFSSGVASNPPGSSVIISYTTSVTQRWYHACFTGDGTNLRLYIDGIQRATGLVASRTYPVTTSSIAPTLARRDYWSGQMANVALYTRGLTADEVLQNYNATKTRFGL